MRWALPDPSWIRFGFFSPPLQEVECPGLIGERGL